MVQNTPELSEIVPNGHKWFQMVQYNLELSKIISGPKWSQIVQKKFKMVQNVCFLIDEINIVACSVSLLMLTKQFYY